MAGFKSPLTMYTDKELEAAPPAHEGQYIRCHRCGGQHKLRASSKGLLLYYICSGTEWLAGVKGKLVIETEVVE